MFDLLLEMYESVWLLWLRVAEAAQRHTVISCEYVLEQGTTQNLFFVTSDDAVTRCDSSFC